MSGDALRERYEAEARIEWLDGWEDTLFVAYSDLRKIIRGEMRITDESRIDRHKIAAAITYSILQTPPLKITSKVSSNSISWRARYSNVSLALMVSIGIILRFSGYDVHRREPGHLRHYRELGFSWPVTRDTQETYVKQFVKGLLYTAQCNRTDEGKLSNAYLLANIYFMLEAYHLSRVKYPQIEVTENSFPHIPIDLEGTSESTLEPPPESSKE
jgi:hypothetical protein